MASKAIEHFWVNQDVQIQIDHENKAWFDEHGKLLIEDVEEYLRDNNFIEDNIGEWRDTSKNKIYSFIQDDIDQLKRCGFCKMYLVG